MYIVNSKRFGEKAGEAAASLLSLLVKVACMRSRMVAYFAAAVRYPWDPFRGGFERRLLKA